MFTSLVVVVLGTIAWFGLSMFADLLDIVDNSNIGRRTPVYYVFRFLSWASAVLAIAYLVHFVKLCYNLFVG